MLAEDYSRFLTPGEPEVGWVARNGRIPLGYFNDAAATARTFPEVAGQRVVVSGDRAALEPDGSLRLYGRDSLVVNTGGEKVFVEEVEEVLRAHPRRCGCSGGGSAQRTLGSRGRRDRLGTAADRGGHRGASRALRDTVGALQDPQGRAVRRSDPQARQRQGRLSVGQRMRGRRSQGMTSSARPVIDCLANVHFGETENQPAFMTKVRDDYFKGPKSMYDPPIDLAELLDEMDTHGVRRAILMDSLAKPSVTARKFVDAHPDRFALAMGGGVNLLRPIPSLRELAAIANDLPVAYAVVGPSFWGRRPVSAERRGVLPALHQVRRMGTSLVRQHRYPGTADPPRRGAEPDSPGPSAYDSPNSSCA